MIRFLKTRGEKPYFYNVGRGKNPVESIIKVDNLYVITTNDRVTQVHEDDVAIVEFDREED